MMQKNVRMNSTFGMMMMTMLMMMMRLTMMMMSSTLNWVQEEVAKFLQCSSIDSMLPSLPESGANLDFYLYL